MVTAQTRIMTSTNPAVKFIRDRVLPLIMRRDAVQKKLVPRMLGLKKSRHNPAIAESKDRVSIAGCIRLPVETLIDYVNTHACNCFARLLNSVLDDHSGLGS